MGFGVYRSGSTLAASLALVHRYPSSVLDSLPVSSSEYRQLHPPYRIYNVMSSQMVPSSASPPQMCPCSLDSFTRIRPAPPYWLLSSSLSSSLYIFPSRMTAIASVFRANASTQSLQKLVSSHRYHHQNGIQYSGFTLLLHLQVSHAVERGPSLDATIAIVRTGIGSLGRIWKRLWRIYGKVRKKDSGWSDEFDYFPHW